MASAAATARPRTTSVSVRVALVRLAAGLGSDDELLPQPLGVLACELARQRVEAAHALDRDEKGFVPRQACRR